MNNGWLKLTLWQNELGLMSVFGTFEVQLRANYSQLKIGLKAIGSCYVN